ncbi:MAG: peptidoglycan-binding protein, partial [Alphaproteobacteria bacterium]|nr:peptidoglycan-binding protein [Alphaproteobacteria bacterium]
FLAQLGHESNGLTHREENLNYSATRLMEIWPSRFPTLDIAKQYDRDPEKLANFVYGGRMGNVNTGDGYRFRGRGYIQLTGRDAYRDVGKIAGLDLETHPELAASPEHAVKIACAFWTWKKINPACDVGDFTAVTKKINGGTNGLDDRLEWLTKVKSVVAKPPSATPATTPKPTTATPATPKPAEQPETMANESVLQAQKKLTRLGYYKGVVNGIYNQMMRAALWAFQKDEDLPQTGRLDAKTREELNV